eukprot:979595-Pelagomonas_calceolata.AAC.1
MHFIASNTYEQKMRFNASNAFEQEMHFIASNTCEQKIHFNASNAYTEIMRCVAFNACMEGSCALLLPMYVWRFVLHCDPGAYAVLVRFNASYIRVLIVPPMHSSEHMRFHFGCICAGSLFKAPYKAACCPQCVQATFLRRPQ